METYKIIKKFLAEGGRCILIEDDKPIGVVLTIEEYELLRSKSEIRNPKSKAEPIASNPIGEAIAKEMDFPDLSAEASAKAEASAEISDIEAVDDVTLEDLGVDELPY